VGFFASFRNIAYQVDWMSAPLFILGILGCFIVVFGYLPFKAFDGKYRQPQLIQAVYHAHQRRLISQRAFKDSPGGILHERIGCNRHPFKPISPIGFDATLHANAVHDRLIGRDSRGIQWNRHMGIA
jgi:hypothetical protein